MKKIFVLVATFFFVSVLSAQQITKFGVVDTAKVYNAYFRNSASVRNYERRKTEFQNEINAKTEEIRKLQEQKLVYQKANDEMNAKRIESEITKKTDYLREYTNAKNIELANLQKSLENNSFYRKLYDELGKIAEAGGYSLILSLQQNNAILWYSTSVDVTDDVIAALSGN